MDIQKKIKIILADKNENARRMLCSMLEKERDITVIAEAADSVTVLQLTHKLMPDIVVLDYTMPSINCLDNIKHIITASPYVKVLVVSIYCDSRMVVRMLHAGASGYLLKDLAYEELTSAIKTISLGKTYISPGIAGITIEENMILS